MKINPKNLLEDATGPWAFHIPMLLFGAPMAILSSTLQDYDSTNPVTLFPWAFASSIGYAALLVFALGLNQLQKKTHFINSKRFAVYLGLCFLLGSTKGVLTGLLGGFLDPNLNFNNALTPRFISSGLIGMLAIPAGSAFLTGREKFLAKRNSLIREAIGLQQINLENNYSISQLRASAKVDTETQLGTSVQDLLISLRAEQSSFDEQWQSISNKLRALIQNDIRPKSTNLWNEHEIRFPAIGMREVIRISITRFKFPITLVLFLIAIATYGDSVRHPNGTPPLVHVLWAVLSISIPYFLLKVLMRYTAIKGNVAFLGLLVCSTFLQTVRFYILPTNHQLADEIANSILFLSFFLAIMVAFGGIQMFRETSEGTLQNLQDFIDTERVRAVATTVNKEIVNRDVARYLHGHLQTRLMSMALLLEQAGKSNDQEKIDELLQSIEIELQNPMNRFEISEFENLEDAIENIESLWAGIVDISATFNFSNSNLSQQVVNNVYTLLEEAVTNAVRHGKATNISITIALKNKNHIEIIVHDDGEGTTQMQPGLGSALFTTICGDNWSLTTNPSAPGSIFTAEITI